MPVVTSREFNHDIARAKRETETGPVIITTRDEPTHVLLSYKDYIRLTGGEKTLADLLFVPGAAEIDVDFPRLNLVGREIDL